MARIDDFDSPIYQHKLSDDKKVKRLLRISDCKKGCRANKTMQRYVSRNYKPNMWSGIDKQDFIYYVEIGIGTFDGYLDPFQKNYLIFDTGSQVTWTQCEGCTRCFRHRGDNFRRTRSQTYHHVDCDQCPPGFCEGDHCTHKETYLDGTSMEGIYAKERFIIGHETVDDQLEFVCAMKTTLSFPASGTDPNNIITGILGMSKGPDSFISQLGERGGYKYSYCLRDWSSQNQMYLSFGPHVLDITSNMYVTEILDHSDHLHVELIAISVAKKRLNIPREVFMFRSDNSGGTIIDTGSAMTHLVSRAFTILVEEISSYIERNNPPGLVRRHRDSNPQGYEACWEPLFNNPPVDLPTLKFRFRGNAYLFLEVANVFIILQMPGLPSPGLYCLAMFRAETDLNAIGARQMVDQRIIVNLQTSQFFFTQADCSLEDW